MTGWNRLSGKGGRPSILDQRIPHPLHWWSVAHPQRPAPLRARDLGFWLLTKPYGVWSRSGHHPCAGIPSHHTTVRFPCDGEKVVTVLVWRGLFCTMQTTYYKSASLWSASRPTRPCPMPVRGAFKKPALTGASGTTDTTQESPPTAAPGSTDGQGGDGGPDGDSGTPPAASDAQPPSDEGPLAWAHESPEVTKDVAAEVLAAPPENVTLNAVFGDADSDGTTTTTPTTMASDLLRQRSRQPSHRFAFLRTSRG